MMRRILTLDGGGIRGVFSLQVLARIEHIFRTARGRPALVLRDEFDFFAGTSTGAIIATCLAWGMPVSDIEELYVEHGREMFAKARWYARWKSKYDADPIANMFRSRFCEDDPDRTPALLGTSKLFGPAERKYLLVVMRNASTGSPWPVCNNPDAMFNDTSRPDCNLRIPIWKLLRASTAAPTYFRPEAIDVGGTEHVFIDGGLTPFNNPAFIAALTAMLPCYRIQWQTGVDKLLVVSVGTGLVRARLEKRDPERINVVDQARSAVPALMGSVSQQQDMLCRLIGSCQSGAPLDLEVGDLKEPSLFGTSEKKFSYLRYNREFTPAESARLLSATGQKFALDNLGLIPFLKDAGRDYARASVHPEDVLRH
ncbi:MAG: patatin-like phospholipase family protein [Vicinamibacterales bacterium]